MDLLSKESLLTLPIEIIDIIIDDLNTKDKHSLSHVCRTLRQAVRINHFGVSNPIWKNIEFDNLNEELPSSLNYRDGVYIDGKFYIVVLSKFGPICWVLDLIQKYNWKKVKVTICMDKMQYNPVKSTVGAVIKHEVYMFGGECLITGRPTKNLYKLDLCTMSLFLIPENEKCPSPRFMHSLNVIDHYRLILFGGRCIANNNKFYDTKDLFIYDTRKNIWIQQIASNLPYARSFHSVFIRGGKLYIYGGQHITSSSPESSIHDDEDIWEYNFWKNKWRRYSSFSNFFCPEFSTIGIGPGKRCGAAIFPLRRKIVILGGTKKQMFTVSSRSHNEKNLSEQQMMVILCPIKRVWENIQIKNMPDLDCIAIKIDRVSNNIFIVGKTSNEKLVAGWII
ncbi:4815_t:CDS:2 [Diversispora eburnea]|uniref:4815_t:CDS:1 n=1 Tax=Diversispora eburnea TaxID=1213867 RepID=A0A9N9AUD8_9GLOM|nr:4815_t:CDS:2 [Diversispora eburnea]